MDWPGCKIVEVVPGKVSGVPLIRGTRMPVQQVIESLDLGETVEGIAYNHDLDPADVLCLQAHREAQRTVLHQ